tara:strand:+ start:409 stop:615 length:207 start_codon:yes stop_codon:yes gene_type:complete
MELNALVMYEAQRTAVEALLTKPGSKARNESGSVGINQLKAISSVRWTKSSDGQIRADNTDTTPQRSG